MLGASPMDPEEGGYANSPAIAPKIPIAARKMMMPMTRTDQKEDQEPKTAAVTLSYYDHLGWWWSCLGHSGISRHVLDGCCSGGLSVSGLASDLIVANPSSQVRRRLRRPAWPLCDAPEREAAEWSRNRGSNC